MSRMLSTPSDGRRPLGTAGVSERHLWWLLIAALATGFYLNLGGVPLFDVDEGAFSEATREMFVRGDFISTYLNGAPRYDKPILIYWLQAASILAFGVSEFAFRLPSALSATLWVFVIYRFGSEFLDRKTGLVAAIITATAVGVTLIGKAATADALLNLLIAATMLDIYRYHRRRERHVLYRVFLWMGLGVLTKGPVALLIPFVVSFAFFWRQRELRVWLASVRDPLGLSILAAIALPWYVAQYLKEGEAFIAGFFYKHNLGRFQGPMEGHGGSLLYYLPVVLVATLPYTPLLLGAVRRMREARTDDLSLYLWMWFAFVLVFFSLSGTKLPHYILYGATPLFILMAQRREELRSRVLTLLPALLLAGALLLLPEIAERVRAGVHDPRVAAMLGGSREAFGSGYRWVLGLLLLAIAGLALDRRLANGYKLLLSGILITASLALTVIPAVASLQQQSIKEAGLRAKTEDGPVVTWHLNAPSFSVYSGKVAQRRPPRPGDLVLTRADLRTELAAYELLYERHGIILLRMTDRGYDVP
jgi:hypothetical protein